MNDLSASLAERGLPERVAELEAELADRQRGDELQRALYEIAALSAADSPEHEHYARLHDIVSRLMDARNFIIATYDAEQQVIRTERAHDFSEILNPDNSRRQNKEDQGARMSDPVTLEICVDSPQSALAAERGGANRIELCTALFDGGTTPSAGMIATVRSRTTCILHSDDELAAMKRDIAAAKELRTDGVVFGILTPDGSVDVPRCRELLECARPLKATFHRAFDMSRDLGQSLEDIIALGFDRVLTSGGEQKVQDAIPVVRRLRERASNRIALMIGSGIRSGNARELTSQTGVREIHASARRVEPSPMRYRNEKVRMGTLPVWEYQRAIVDEEEVRNLMRAISNDRNAFPLT